MMELSLSGQNFVSCRNCLALMAANAGFCAACGSGIDEDAPKTLAGKIKRFLGIEISSEIVSIKLEDDGQFFTNREIEELLDMENVLVLGLEDVPDRDAMFYRSRRIGKPVNRK
jgi:hypothetical protein